MTTATIPTHHTVGEHSEVVRRRLSLLPVGGKMRDLPPDLWHKSYVRNGHKKTGGPNLRLLRLLPDRPAHTVTAYIFNKFAHPREDRYITPREAARLQGFPDDYVFCGPLTSVQMQIGNAVPVHLATSTAIHVNDYLRKYFKKESEEYHAVSLFSGAGGMDLGFRQCFKILSAVEFVPEFCQTLRANMANVNVVEGDIANVKGKELSEGKMIHLVFGGPPCQSFSAAGKQKGFSDPRGKLVVEFTRIVEELKPEVFVMENVPGMLGIGKGLVVKKIVEGFERVGYLTETHVLCAADYGAPQIRRRLFFLGRKKKYAEPFGAPLRTHSPVPDIFGKFRSYVGVIDAIGDLPQPQRRP